MRPLHPVVMAMIVMGALLLQIPRALASPSNSVAQYKPTSARALAHFEEGNRLYKRGVNPAQPFADRVRDLKAAIAAYLAGSALEDAPAFDFNIAHASWVLVDNAAAVAHLLRFLQRAHPDDQLRATIEKEIAQIDPSGSIRADLLRAREPAPKTEDAVTPAAPPRAPVSAPAVSSTPLVPQPSPIEQRTTTISDRAEPQSQGWTWLGWSLTAAGVVGGGVTTWLAVSASSLDSESQELRRPLSERADLHDRADSRRGAAMIVGIGSGAAVVLGIVTLVFPARSAGRHQTTSWNLGPTGNGAAVFGRF